MVLAAKKVEKSEIGKEEKEKKILRQNEEKMRCA